MKKIVVIILVAFCVIYLVSAPILSGFLVLQDERKRDDVFVELWHVDTFEGGKNSRGEFLKKVAVELNKKNKNEFVVVKTISEIELVERLKNGKLPEMLSFGTGLGEILEEYLVENNVGTGQREWLDECVKKDGKTFATPYAFGGYFLVGKNKPLIYATGTVLSPLLALYFDGEYSQYTAMEKAEKPSTYEAYLQFIERGGSLVGTQRDVVRIGNRIDSGKSPDVEIKPLTGFVDMIMAIGLTQIDDPKKLEASQRFVEYLLSESVQARLFELRMFPARDIEIYSIPHFSDYEKAIEKPRCINIFTPNEILKKNNILAKNAICGDEKSQKFLEEFFK
ncbi:MAG: hypothetical protein RR458_04900 [Clostridia bacterium]